MTRLLNPIVKEICLDDYKHEHLHATTGALFDINEVWLALGEQTDAGYSAGMVTGPDPESSGEALLQCVIDGDITDDELRTSYAVIKRYDELLRSKGYEL
jgi:hypothetical protein